MKLIKYSFLSYAFFIGIIFCVNAFADINEPILDAVSKYEKDEEDGKSEAANLPKEIRIEKDSSVMMLIPAGSFWRGIKIGTTHHDAPLHKVYLKSFYMDKSEVTNSQYATFLKETGFRPPLYWNDPRFNDPMFPVVGVRWKHAVAYAEWAGKRLPTEAEWEKAARGGLEAKNYPWGDEIGVAEEHANFHSMQAKPVASYSPNGYGLFDMAGNVWEWVADYYGANYYNMAELSNPPGPEEGRNRIVRGGAFNTSGQSLMCGHRHYYDPNLSMYMIGFRCAKDVE